MPHLLDDLNTRTLCWFVLLDTTSLGLILLPRRIAVVFKLMFLHYLQLVTKKEQSIWIFAFKISLCTPPLFPVADTVQVSQETNAYTSYPIQRPKVQMFVRYDVTQTSTGGFHKAVVDLKTGISWVVGMIGTIQLHTQV